MALALGISAYSLMEGVYLPEDLARLALHLGYTDLALVDRGLHGFPRMREAAEKVGLRLHVGCRLPLGDGEVYVIPIGRQGYGAMNKAITDLAHGRTGSWPEDCVLLADRWSVALALREQAPTPELVSTPPVSTTNMSPATSIRIIWTISATCARTWPKRRVRTTAW